MRIAGSLLSLVLAAMPLAAQTKVALPHAIGTLTLPTGWTALAATELAAETRASDPAAEPARALLTAMVAEIRRANRTAENVLLHAAGPVEGQLRTINAYSAEVAATAAELQTDKAIDQIRRALDDALASPGVEVVFLGSTKPELFAVGSIALTFRLKVGEVTMHNQMYVVPAGERLAYFETQFLADDVDAPLAIAGVLRTFDGARDAPDDSTIRKMLLGGAAGAIAGIAVALLRRRRQQRPRIGVDDPATADQR